MKLVIRLQPSTYCDPMGFNGGDEGKCKLCKHRSIFGLARFDIDLLAGVISCANNCDSHCNAKAER